MNTKIVDLHIHSKYSRATSKLLDLEHLDESCVSKGIDLVATGDFTHPAWFAELSDKLEEKESGIFSLKGSRSEERRVGKECRSRWAP